MIFFRKWKIKKLRILQAKYVEKIDNLNNLPSSVELSELGYQKLMDHRVELAGIEAELMELGAGREEAEELLRMLKKVKS